ARPAPLAARVAAPARVRSASRRVRGMPGRLHNRAKVSRLSAPTMPPPPIQKIVETILYADDMPRAMAFYSEVMGLKAIAGDSERFRVFDAGAGAVLILFKRGGTLQPT